MGELKTYLLTPSSIGTSMPSDVIVPMPYLNQDGEVFVGPGAKKEAESLGLGLAKLSSKRKDDLAAAKRFAMDASIKEIMIRQKKSQQENQQKQMMYSQVLGLMGRIYIGSISPEIKEENIRKAFEVFGPIKSINMSYDLTTGQHKGFAFMEFDVPEAALLASESMNGQLIGGRNLKISLIGRPANIPQAQPFIEMMQNDAKKYFRVYIASVHPEVTEKGLKSVFEEFGEVLRCQLAKQTGYGKSSNHRGFGYIEFSTRAAMVEAISGMNMFDLGGQFIRVGRCITPPEALQYMQPSSTSSVSALPPAAALAAAEITAKLLAASKNSKTEPTSSSPPPSRDYAKEAKSRLSARQKPSQPLAITGNTVLPSSPGGSVPSPFSTPIECIPPPPRVLPPAPEIWSPESGEISFSSAVLPGIFDPLAETSKKRNKRKGDAISIDEKFNKLFKEKKSLWEESTMAPAEFISTDSLNIRKMEEKTDEKKEQLAITGNVPSLALALKPEEQSLIAVGQAKPQEEKRAEKTGKKGHFGKSSNRIKEPKKIQPKLNSATKVAAAHAAGAISDAIRQEVTSAEDLTLFSQECLNSIRGNDARHLLMAKLLRTNRSSVLILRNMVEPKDIDEHLEEEIRTECNKFGRIVDILIANDEQANIVKIFINYTEPTEVDEAVKSLDGRTFGGRIIKAEAYDQALFDHGDLTG